MVKKLLGDAVREVSTTDMNGKHKIKAKEELNLLKKSYPYNVSERS